MAYSLVTAKYGNIIIGAGDYQKKVHQGKIYCPYCDLIGHILKVKYDKRGFFAAWQNEGRHKCGIGQVAYLDSKWVGRELVEIIQNEDHEMEVSIDIFSGFRGAPTTIQNIDIDNCSDKKKKEYKRYKEKKRVFRNVIRSVKQLKKMLENNEFRALKSIDFKYKVGSNESLTLDELLIMPHQISNTHINKNRFVICKAEFSPKINSKQQYRFLKAYLSQKRIFQVGYKVEERENPFSGMKDEYILAYGRIKKSKYDDSFILWLNNDYHIEKVENEFGDLYYSGINLESNDILKRHDQSKYTQSHIAHETDNTIAPPDLKTNSNPLKTNISTHGNTQEQEPKSTNDINKSNSDHSRKQSQMERRSRSFEALKPKPEEDNEFTTETKKGVKKRFKAFISKFIK